MKFKIIFAMFNAIIVFSFLFIFLMPFFILGWNYTQLFWSHNWFLGAIFVVIMIALNLYFAANWKVFGFLEREDWDALIAHLENRIFKLSKVSRHEIRILINTYVVKSNTDAILQLETDLRRRKPSMVPSFALQFGIPHLLKNDPIDMEIYYGEMMKNRRCSDREWITWNFAFSLMLQQKTGDAKRELLKIAAAPRSAVLNVLTLYLLDAYAASDQDVTRAIESGKAVVRKRFSYTRWRSEIEKSKSNLQVLVLARLIDDATTWLFPDSRNSAVVRS